MPAPWSTTAILPAAPRQLQPESSTAGAPQRPSCSLPPPPSCDARPDVAVRIALGLFGLGRGTRYTQPGIEKNLLEPLRQVPNSKLDVFIHSLIASSGITNTHAGAGSEGGAVISCPLEVLQIGPPPRA